MTRQLSKDTTLCISLSGRPSNLGTRFHNHLYDALDLDFVYKAFTTTDLRAAIGGVRALGIRGCSVSMPFKEEVLEHVDEVDPSAAVIESVNTVVNDDGHLTAYNTDYLAVLELVRESATTPETAGTAAVVGSGGMAKAVVAALVDLGFSDGTVVARNETTGRALAERYGYGWTDDLGGRRPGLLVNATPVGMAGGPAADDLPVDPAVVAAARTVVEVVAVPAETPLLRLAREHDLPTVTGSQIVARQALEQFVRYTGVRPSEDQVAAAREFSQRT